MSTLIIEMQTAAPCFHLHQTQPRPGRGVCNDCGQRFYSGIPYDAWPEENPETRPAPEVSTALATIETDEDNLSSSIATMPADELHKEIVQTYLALGANAVAYQALVLDARRRMGAGEQVGGYTTWGEYADCYLKRLDESLPSCLRRLRRALEGTNPDTKHRNRRTKSNRKILEEPLDEAGRLAEIASAEGYERGFADGDVSGEKKAKSLAGEVVGDTEADYRFDEIIGVAPSSFLSQQLADKFANYAVSNIPENGMVSTGDAKFLLRLARQYLAQRGR